MSILRLAQANGQSCCVGRSTTGFVYNAKPAIIFGKQVELLNTTVSE
jgi:hypothetical protein